MDVAIKMLHCEVVSLLPDRLLQPHVCLPPVGDPETCSNAPLSEPEAVQLQEHGVPIVLIRRTGGCFEALRHQKPRDASWATAVLREILRDNVSMLQQMEQVLIRRLREADIESTAGRLWPEECPRRVSKQPSIVWRWHGWILTHLHRMPNPESPDESWAVRS